MRTCSECRDMFRAHAWGSVWTRVDVQQKKSYPGGFMNPDGFGPLTQGCARRTHAESGTLCLTDLASYMHIMCSLHVSATRLVALGSGWPGASGFKATHGQPKFGGYRSSTRTQPCHQREFVAQRALHLRPTRTTRTMAMTGRIHGGGDRGPHEAKRSQSPLPSR